MDEAAAGGRPMDVGEIMTTVQMETGPQIRAQAAPTETDQRTAAIERLHAALAEVRRRCPTLPVLAIPWIHVQHPIHPVQNALMTREEAPRARVPSYAALLKEFAFSLLYAGYLTARLLQLRWALCRPLAALRRERFDVVAKTWRFGATQAADGRDFYYGDLQRRLAARGVRMLLICGDAQGRGWLGFARGNISMADARWQVPEWCVVPLSAPWVMVCQQLAAAIRLRRLAMQEQQPFLQLVAARASRECASRRIMPTGLNRWMVRAAVRRWHPHTFMTLYEGRAWERCAWWGAKEMDHACRTVGYQHTILLPHNRALLAVPTVDDPLSRPDVALCLGPRTHAMLQSSHPRSTTISFGTFRATPDRTILHPPAPQRRTILVLPEGYVSESALLFNAAMEAARRLPDHHFILRLHPILPLTEVRLHLAQDPAALANVELSPGGPIERDFARSSVILYRGSSSVLYAVAYGLKPVYLHFAHQHDIDPLFELEGWRERADAAQTLAHILERYAQTDAVIAMDVWRAAADYVQSYAVPVSDDAIDQFVKAINLSPVTGHLSRPVVAEQPCAV